MHYLALTSLPLAGLVLSAQPLPRAVEPGGEIPNLREPQSARCNEVIREVRETGGLPALQRGPATGEDGYMIAAVDKRVDGCAVMQMHGDVNDLRPLPEPTEDYLLRPAGE
ncbi:hypothetical protein [Qipengyuania gaetbuli]|uniref:hypothetical protein n=1 Tax=Qipengyuania gaetbuli TaxID=266952 RepID=UPI001CFDE00F|nr:hypothetical protein [Qipengyuania gaetbuli]